MNHQHPQLGPILLKFTSPPKTSTNYNSGFPWNLLSKQTKKHSILIFFIKIQQNNSPKKSKCSIFTNIIAGNFCETFNKINYKLHYLASSTHKNRKMNSKIRNMSARSVSATSSSSSSAANLSLMWLICMAYLINPTISWMPDVRPDMPSSKFLFIIFFNILLYFSFVI